MPLGIVAIEWAERLQYKPDHYLQVCLTYQDKGRQVEIVGIGELSDFKLEI